MNNQPPLYPLQGHVPKFDCNLSNPNSKLADIWLQKEYQKLSLNHTRENRKRRNGDNANDSEELESWDDMMLSDAECANSVSILSSARELHAPKRRLTSVSSPISALTPSAPEISENISDMEGSISGNTVSEIARASNTPVAVVDEQVQQLPLPSPSASPIHSASKEDIMDPVEQQLVGIPATQLELIEKIQNLSKFLSDKNQNYLIFKLLQNINRSSLSSLGNIIQSSLKRDLISNLPAEISYNILSQLDYKTLHSVSNVCNSWYKLSNNTTLWTKLLTRDHLIDSEEAIEKELANPQKLIEEWASPSVQRGDINVAQLLYKKRRLIYERWMNPTYEPKRISVPVPGQGANVVTCLQHDDEKVIIGMDDRLINIYSTRTGELLRVLKGHEGGVWALKYTGNTLVSGSTDRSIRVWNIKTGKCTHIFKGHTSTVRCLDILHPVKIGVDETGQDIIYPKEPLLVTGSRDHNLNVWKLPLVPEDGSMDQDHAEPLTYDSNDPSNPYLVKVLLGHNSSVRSVSGYGNLIVSGSYDATLRVWDLLDGGKCKFVLTGHNDRIYTTVLNFKTKRCYSGSMDSTVNIWNVETGELLHTLVGHNSLVGLLELSDEYLVSAAADATLRVWDPRTGQHFTKLDGHTAAITCFQHDPLRIVSGSEKMLKLWDMKTGTPVRDLLADITGGIWQVRFDSNRCVAAVQRGRNDEEETFIEILDFSTPPNQ